MATILRGPIVSAPQTKRPIAAVDYFSRPLTLGINPNAAVDQLDQSAPPRKRAVYVDAYPNLLGTTLAAVPPALALPLLIELLDDSSNRKKRNVTVDVYPNLLGTTLAAPLVALDLPLNAVRWDASAPRVKVAVTFEIPQNTLARQDVPQVQQLEAKEQRKYKVQVDTYPNLSTTTLAPPAAILALPLNAIRWDWSAPPRKRPVTIDQPLHRAVWRDAVPKVQQLIQSAPPPKKPARVSDPPNLQATTLYVPPAPSTEFYVTVPYLIGDTQVAAQMRIASIFCTPSITGTEGTVTFQSPDAFTLVARGTTISITLGGDENSLQPPRGQVPYNRNIH